MNPLSNCCREARRGSGKEFGKYRHGHTESVLPRQPQKVSNEDKLVKSIFGLLKVETGNNPINGQAASGFKACSIDLPEFT